MPSSSRRLQALSAHVATAAAAPAATAAPMRAMLRDEAGGIPFEAWAVGQKYYTSKRTISDSDISTYVQVVGFQVRACGCPAAAAAAATAPTGAAHCRAASQQRGPSIVSLGERL